MRIVTRHQNNVPILTVASLDITAFIAKHCKSKETYNNLADYLDSLHNQDELRSLSINELCSIHRIIYQGISSDIDKKKILPTLNELFSDIFQHESLPQALILADANHDELTQRGKNAPPPQSFMLQASKYAARFCDMDAIQVSLNNFLNSSTTIKDQSLFSASQLWSLYQIFWKHIKADFKSPNSFNFLNEIFQQHFPEIAKQASPLQCQSFFTRPRSNSTPMPSYSQEEKAPNPTTSR